MRKAINLAVIDGKKILLVKKDDVWILPGGKPIWNESDYGCLIREIGEELGAKIILKNYYSSFIGKTPHTGDELESRVYFGDLTGSINPSGEISGARFVNNFSDYPISEITKKIINSLRRDYYL